MDRDTVEKYKSEMIDIYNSNKKSTVEKDTLEGVSFGKLVVIASTLKGLYPVADVEITVFTGNYNDKNTVKTVVTDESGRTEEIPLKTPKKALSLETNENTIPYSKYNILTKAEGYVDNIYFNIPIFSGVTSLQRVNMMTLESAGEKTEPIIYDEAKRYNL